MMAQLAMLALATTSATTINLPVDYIHPHPAHDPRIAGGLSLAVNGAGQFYNGEDFLGWLLLAPTLAYPIAWGADTLGGSTTWRLADLVLILGAKGYSVWEAYHRDLPVPAPTGSR